jgi:hypothetical protein
MRYALLLAAVLIISGCDMSFLSTIADKTGYVWTGSFCVRVVADQSRIDDNAIIYDTKSECLDMKGTSEDGLKDNNLLCDLGSECKSGYCEKLCDGCPGFCEDAPATNPYYVDLTCYDGCVAIKTMQKPSTDCDDIGFADEKADTCYETGEYCGNGELEASEECDGRKFSVPRSCVDYGNTIDEWYWTGGYLTCRNDCTIDQSDCQTNYAATCESIDGAYCGSFNWNPLKYTAVDRVVYCPDDETCYIERDTSDEDIHTDIDIDQDGVADWQDKDPRDPNVGLTEVNVVIDSGTKDDSKNIKDYLLWIVLGVVVFILLLFMAMLLGILFAGGRR